jgi:hypothetical protein
MIAKLTLAVLLAASSFSHVNASDIEEQNTQTWGGWLREKAALVAPTFITEQLENFRKPVVEFVKERAKNGVIDAFSGFAHETSIKNEIIGKMNLPVSYAEMMYSLFSGDKTWEDAYKKVSTTVNTMLVDGVDVARDNAAWYTNFAFTTFKYGVEIVSGFVIAEDKTEFLKTKGISIALEQFGGYALSGFEQAVEGVAFTYGGYIGWMLAKAALPVFEKMAAPLVVPVAKTVIPATINAAYTVGKTAVNTVYNAGTWVYGKVFA